MFFFHINRFFTLLFKIQCYNLIIENLLQRGDDMERMQCDNCGHVYDKDEGDPKNNVAPGTSWADVPADYKCPQCGAGKDKFIIE